MADARTLLLSRADVAALLSLDECIGAVESAFRAHANGETPAPAVLGFHVQGGGFHAKAAALGRYVAVKLNANFPGNRTKFKLPTIQGLITLFDRESGFPLLVMDSVEITILRTGAATAVAAKYLARRDSSIVTICGCGTQGRIQLHALRKILPLNEVHAFDSDSRAREAFRREVSELPGVRSISSDSLESSIRTSDVVVTCTPSKQPFVQRPWLSPGSFLAAVGSDSEDKQELDPELLAAHPVVVDSAEQCGSIGELHHAIKSGLMSMDSVYATLGDVIAGKKQGRISPDQIFIFDSTGTALQDVAAAIIVYEKAKGSGNSRTLNFFEQ